MKKLKLTFAFANLLLLLSCGSARVYVKPNTSFNKQMTITLTGTSNDNAGLISEIQFELSSRGFNMVSESVAKNAINKSTNGSLSSNSFSINTQLNKSIELKSVYALNSKYNYIQDAIGIGIRNYQGELVDLFTGEVVMNLSFRGNRTPRNLAKKIVSEIDSKVK